MKANQLTHERDSWQTLDQRPQNGTQVTVEPAANGSDQSIHQPGWQQMIDQKLMAWRSDPSLIEDEGLDPPSAEGVDRAIDFARALQQAGYPPPTNVVPDPNGGIVFHRRHEDLSEELHFWDDGAVDYCRFDGGCLLERRQL